MCGARRGADDRAMSAHPNLHARRGEPSGEQVFFVMAIAFWVLVAMIIFGFFLPVVVAVALIFRSPPLRRSPTR